jgi:two-component system response regulator
MKPITTGRPIEILLVEDSATDVMLAEEALEQAKLRNNLHVVKDGVEAMAFLRKQGKYADVPRPDLMLLDLNMPRKDGREVLAEVKSDDNLKYIPVVVLTTSQAQEDVLKAYGLHANCYISKPVDFEQFANVVRAIDQFWFTVVTLPTGGDTVGQVGGE